MDYAYVLGYSKPKVPSDYPLAGFYVKNKDISKLENYHGIDYSGGGVVASMENLLKFIKALAGNQLINNNTLSIMMEDRKSLWLWNLYVQKNTIDFTGLYGLLGQCRCYRCLYVLSSGNESYIIGNFNDLAYKTKAIQFMLFKVVKELTKLKS
ncbi:hypothetical protein [Aquiflexum sp.]|uniref:hypothetical protein n=1 Tax=Aquiflexum sp. TaxID=1872584 RepID=UPI0035942204